MTSAHFDDLMARAALAFAGGDLAGAERLYSQAITADPAAPLPVFGLARVWNLRGGRGKAGLFAEKALSLGLSGADADTAQLWFARVQIARGERDTGMARMAAQAIRFEKLPATAFLDVAIARDALSCAACAGDIALAERVFAAQSPDAARHPLTCAPAATLENWCARNDIAVSALEPARPVVIPASSPYSRAFAYQTEPVLLTALSGAEWVPGWDFVIASDGTVLDQTGYMRLTSPMPTALHFYFDQANLVIYPTPARRAEIDDQALFLSAPTVANFGHWMIDFLPRLRALDVIGAPHVKIAVPADLGRKHVETLALWGIGEDRLLRCRRDTRYRFRTLHVLIPGCAMPPNPTHVDFVRARHYPKSAPARGSKRIFLARTNVGTRQVANADEFEALLRREGFVSLEMADLSIAEQRAQLADADILLGAFGTNLLALYFAPPSCTVIALMDNVEHDPTVAPTAALLGMRHQFFVCSPAQDRGRYVHAKDTDIVVDCVALKRRLDEIAAPL